MDGVIQVVEVAIPISRTSTFATKRPMRLGICKVPVAAEDNGSVRYTLHVANTRPALEAGDRALGNRPDGGVAISKLI